jgi:hypothetical protein
MKHPSDVSRFDTYRLVASAVSKWIPPMILCALDLGWCNSSNNFTTTSTTTTNHNSNIATPDNIRFPSLCLGLCFCFLTIKLVVFGMARMAYASIQWPDLVPLMMIVMVHVTVLAQKEEEDDDGSRGRASWSVILKDRSHDLYRLLLTLAYLARLVLWTRSVVNPLCQRMNIHLFRINHDPSKTKKKM